MQDTFEKQKLVFNEENILLSFERSDYETEQSDRLINYFDIKNYAPQECFESLGHEYVIIGDIVNNEVSYRPSLLIYDTETKNYFLAVNILSQSTSGNLIRMLHFKGPIDWRKEIKTKKWL